mmetsp:Transcript_47477/g.57498  ORF Transcript_47477/g.57498 Transcript_47477/m.57498 type:complete len:106 (-) Transcript_47477:93-410(-)
MIYPEHSRSEHHQWVLSLAGERFVFTNSVSRNVVARVGVPSGVECLEDDVCGGRLFLGCVNRIVDVLDLGACALSRSVESVVVVGTGGGGEVGSEEESCWGANAV